MNNRSEIRRIPRDPFRFELLRLFDADRDMKGGSLHDPAAAGEFVQSLTQPLTAALGDANLLHGAHIEAMFGAFVVSLGRIAMIKQEDAGDTWTLHAVLRVPDYRVVLADGNQFLVEVKRFYQKDNRLKRYSLSSGYIAGLRKYGELVALPVKLAVYWAAWNLWTLVPLETCETAPTPSLTLERAMLANEMAVLGDVHLATKFPLRLRIVADKGSPRRMDGDGRVVFTIGGVEMYCADRRITGKREQRIAMYFMLYGSWQEDATMEIEDGELVAVDFVRTPIEDHGQGFEFVGSLSSLFSTMHSSSLAEASAVRRIGIKVTAGSLGSLIPEDYRSSSLPLWRFNQQPSEDKPPA